MKQDTKREKQASSDDDFVESKKKDNENNDKPELLPSNITQFSFCCPTDRIFPSRMMIIRVILFNMLEKEQREMKKMLSFWFLAGTIEEERKLKIYILNFIVFSFEEYSRKRTLKRVKNYSSENEN